MNHKFQIPLNPIFIFLFFFDPFILCVNKSTLPIFKNFLYVPGPPPLSSPSLSLDSQPSFMYVLQWMDP